MRDEEMKNHQSEDPSLASLVEQIFIFWLWGCCVEVSTLVSGAAICCAREPFLRTTDCPSAWTHTKLEMDENS